jgi:phosphatidylglycerol lysyltransferase
MSGTVRAGRGIGNTVQPACNLPQRIQALHPAVANVVSPPSRERLYALLPAVLASVTFVVALLVLRHNLARIGLPEVLEQWRTVSLRAVLGAVALTALNYLLLTVYDVLALRYVDARLPYRQVAPTSFTAFAIGHNLGIPSLTGGSIRYRAYALAGLSTPQIATVIGFVALTFGLGAAFLIGVSLLLEPDAALPYSAAPPLLLRSVGVALIAAPLTYLAANYWRRQPWQWRNWTLPIPGLRLALAQLFVAVIDLSLLVGVLYVLLPDALAITYWRLLGAFLLAIGIGAISNVPGGIGVFESVLVLLLHDVDAAALLGAILTFRLVYYVAPLICALALITLQAVATHRDRLRRATRVGGGWLRALAPQAAGMTAFLTGAALIIGGSLPLATERVRLVRELLTLPVLEVSHLVSSAIGAALLIISRGLFRRLHSALQATLVLLSAAFVLSFSNGLHVEHAALVAIAILLLWSARHEFHRGARLLDQAFSIGWILSIVLVIAGSIVLGLFAYRHVEYSNDLWWQFATNADAPRMLRASLLVAAVAAWFGLARLLRPKPNPVAGSEVDPTVIRRIVAASPRTIANLALLGDKRFIVHAEGDAFIMYQTSGRSWIALGGPIGNNARFEELAWQFREAADQHDARCAFYHVSSDQLPIYVDLGLSLAKLGEEARVRLADFNLEDSAHAELRRTRNRAHRDGAAFELVPAERVGNLLDELQHVSDAWLAARRAHEKSFSLGAFKRDYLVNFDCAVVRIAGNIVAFATVWRGADLEELSVDLMRHSTAAPKYSMDYLFTELLLTGKAQNYRWFNLGMAPLAGLEQHELATLWQRLGNLLFRFGENFYNFEGLRRYKEKFLPEWQPRYLASPGGMDLPRVLLDATRLIAGGVREVFVP